MKPICKSEADWQVWRIDNPKYWGRGFNKWCKRLMSRARRRWLKKSDGVDAFDFWNNPEDSVYDSQ